MKKSLSILLAFAMVLTMFASVASAADDMTAQEKFDALAAKGIFAGLDDEGTPGLDQEMTRAQFARVAGLLMGLDFTSPPETATFSDVGTTHWAFEEVEAGVAAGLFVGMGDGTFNDKGNVTIEQIAVVLAEAFNLEVDEDATLEGAHDWAAGAVIAAQAAGLLPVVSDYTANATRSQLVVSSYAAAQAAGIIVPETVTATAAQTGAKVITVSFNKALSADEQAALDIEVKNGFVPYAVKATWAEDGKSVALENNYEFPAGDYDVTVGEQEAITVKVVAQQVVKVEIGAANLQLADGQDLKVAALNQFGEKMANASLTVSAYLNGAALDTSTGKVDILSDPAIVTAAKENDTVVVTAISTSNGISATKTYTLVPASTVTSMQFGTVLPLKDRTRITTGDADLVIPYTFIDQYGNKVSLTANVATPTMGGDDKTHIIGDVYFTTSDKDIVPTSSFNTDKDGVLKFDAGTKAGTAVITAYNTKSGAATSFQIKIEAPASVKSFTLSHPGSLIVEGEAVKFPFVALDQFSQPIDTKEFTKAATSNKVTFVSTNPAVDIETAPGDVSWDGITGELSFTFDGHGATTILVFVDNVPSGQVNVDVKEAAKLVRITGLNDVQTVFAPGGKFTIAAKNVNIIDNYGRVKAGDKVTLPGAGLVLAAKDGTDDVIDVTGTVLTGVKEGSEVIQISLDTVDNSTFEFTATGVKASAVVSYEMSELGTILGANDDDYAKKIVLTGKDANGNVVAIDQSSVVTSYTTSNGAVADISVTGDVYKVIGQGTIGTPIDGTATIIAWQNATKLAEQTVTVSKAAPVVTTVELKAAATEIAYPATSTVALTLTVKNQYGVAVTPAGGYTTSDSSVATVTGSTVNFHKEGKVTIGYITTNGVAATVDITAY